MSVPPDEGLAIAEALVASGRWEAARAALAPLLAAAPQDAQALALMIRTLRALGEREAAISAARALLSTTPDDPYALRLAALVLIDMGWVDEAIGLAHRAVERDPLNARNHLALARAWAESSRPEADQNHLGAAREAVRLAPESPDAHVQVGAALAAAGDAAAARNAYREALRIDPDSSAALNNLAVLDLRAGSPADASRMLAASLRADPHGRIARRNLDAVALTVVNRVGWWLLLAPIPALLVGTAGRHAFALVLAGLAVLGLPALVLRWWMALTRGQRAHLRTLPRRVRWTVWLWPGFTLIAASLALVTAALGASLSTVQLGLYLTVVLYAAVLRALALVSRRGWAVVRGGNAERLGRLRGAPPSAPPPD